TDAEAVAAPGNRSAVLGVGEYLDYDVSELSMIVCTRGAGDIHLHGFSGGVDYQTIRFVPIGWSNDLFVYHSSDVEGVDQAIATFTLADESIPAYKNGGFTMVCLNDVWHMDIHLE
ncbi:unnamed protein product, partial [marine sediment metagenome]